jgi:hypothetical protein
VSYTESKREDYVGGSNEDFKKFPENLCKSVGSQILKYVYYMLYAM